MGKKIERMKCRPKRKAGKEKERVEGNEIMLTCISLKHGCGCGRSCDCVVMQKIARKHI